MFDPAGRINKKSEACRMRFGKTILAESSKLIEDPLREDFIQAIQSHTFDQFASKVIDNPGPAPGGHGSTELIRFARREAGSDDSQSHGLFLKEWDSHCFAQYFSDSFRWVFWLNSRATCC